MRGPQVPACVPSPYYSSNLGGPSIQVRLLSTLSRQRPLGTRVLEEVRYKGARESVHPQEPQRVSGKEARMNLFWDLGFVWDMGLVERSRGQSAPGRVLSEGRAIPWLGLSVNLTCREGTQAEDRKLQSLVSAKTGCPVVCGWPSDLVLSQSNPVDAGAL